MKGVVFNLLEAVVQRAYGSETWDLLIDRSDVTGAYTTLGNYPDEEIEALVGAASAALSLDRDSVLRWFGQNAIPVLAELYPAFFEGPKSAREFTEGVNDIIHAEVRKLYPGAQCPHFRFAAGDKGQMVMDYLSSRRMCALAQGFVEGVAEWYGGKANFVHTACTAHGDPHCTFEIVWEGDRGEAAIAA